MAHVWHALRRVSLSLPKIDMHMQCPFRCTRHPQGTSTYVVNSQRIIDLIMWVGVPGASTRSGCIHNRRTHAQSQDAFTIAGRM